MPLLPSQHQQPLSIAIVGGGIAGVTLTIGLLTHAPHLSITLYEATESFREIGAGVGFQPNYVQTMKLVNPRIAAAHEKCCKDLPALDPPQWFTVRIGDTRKIIGNQTENVVYEKEGVKIKMDEELFTIPARTGPGGGVHRAHFLEELVKLIPDEITKFRKRLADVAEAADGSGASVLHFADGTTARHDVIFGCDGIKSRTRSLVLGDVESASAVFSGKYAYRGLIPMEKAVKILGEKEALLSQMFSGYHGHVLTFPIANGAILNVVAFSSRPTWPDTNWVVQTSQEDLLEDYKHWSPTVREIVSNLESPDIWALFNHLPAQTYYSSKPSICLVGDAAHASTPHQGSGAGMCIEDVYILSHLLSDCNNKTDLDIALRAYDEVRRPRTQKLVKTSREAGMLWDLELEGVHDDLEAFENNASTRMSWLWDHDISKDLEEALNIMKRKRISASSESRQ